MNIPISPVDILFNLKPYRDSIKPMYFKGYKAKKIDAHKACLCLKERKKDNIKIST